LRSTPQNPLKLITKQREHLKRPRPILFIVVVGIFCSPWLLLLGIDTYLRQQQVQTEVQANAFFAQIPVHIGNSSAEQIDRLGAQLGISPNTSYTTPIRINRQAGQAFIAIEGSLNDFLHSQSSKISGPLDPLPTELRSYIEQNQLIINELQSYLLSHEAPQWEMNSDHMSDPDYPAPGFFNIRSLQKLLLLSAMQANQQGQQAKVFDILEASWQLNKTITQRADLSSQVLVAVISAQRAGLLRHIDNAPPYWQTRLRQQSQIQPIMKGMVFESWLRYRISQNAWIPATIVKTDAGLGEKIRAVFTNRFSAQSYFKLTALKNTQTAQRVHEQLIGLNVCTTPQATAEKRLANMEKTGREKGESGSASVVAKRWQTAGMRSLSLELSHHVLQLKARFQATGTWPTQIAPIESTICPGESWLYTVYPDGSISLHLSQTLLSPSAIPLIYHSSHQAVTPSSPVPPLSAPPSLAPPSPLLSQKDSLL